MMTNILNGKKYKEMRDKRFEYPSIPVIQAEMKKQVKFFSLKQIETQGKNMDHMNASHDFSIYSLAICIDYIGWRRKHLSIASKILKRCCCCCFIRQLRLLLLCGGLSCKRDSTQCEAVQTKDNL